MLSSYNKFFILWKLSQLSPFQISNMTLLEKKKEQFIFFFFNLYAQDYALHAKGFPLILYAVRVFLSYWCCINNTRGIFRNLSLFLGGDIKSYVCMSPNSHIWPTLTSSIKYLFKRGVLQFRIMGSCITW